MNAFRPAVAHALKKSMTRRFASAKSVVPKIGSHQRWLSDPSTYPLIIIVGCTTMFMVGMGAHALTTYKDVKIDPRKRTSMLQTWGLEERPHLVKKWVGWNAYPPEGMGIDHKKWKEEHSKSYLEKWQEGQKRQFAATKIGSTETAETTAQSETKNLLSATAVEGSKANRKMKEEDFVDGARKAEILKILADMVDDDDDDDDDDGDDEKWFTC